MLTLGKQIRIRNSSFPYRYKTAVFKLPQNNSQDVSILYEKQTGYLLKRSGKALVGKCPFHEDNRPSFAVYPETQSAHCFGCGWNGTFSWLVKCLNEL